MAAKLMSISEWSERDAEKKMLLGPDAAPAASPGEVFVSDKKLAERPKPRKPA